MGLVVLTIVALAVALSVGLLVRSRSRRRRELDAGIVEALERLAGDRAVEGGLIVDHDSVAVLGGSRLKRRRLVDTAQRGYGPETVARGALELLSDPWSPLDGPLSLKVHGTRVRPHLTAPVVLALLPRRVGIASTRLEVLDLDVTYRIDGSPSACVTVEHLREQAVDTRDLHGIALAVAGQGFQDELLSDALESPGPTSVPAGSVAEAVLVLSEFLDAGQSIRGRLSTPRELELARSDFEWPEPVPAGAIELVIDEHGPRIR